MVCSNCPSWCLSFTCYLSSDNNLNPLPIHIYQHPHHHRSVMRHSLLSNLISSLPSIGCRLNLQYMYIHKINVFVHLDICCIPLIYWRSCKCKCILPQRSPQGLKRCHPGRSRSGVMLLQSCNQPSIDKNFPHRGITRAKHPCAQSFLFLPTTTTPLPSIF